MSRPDFAVALYHGEPSWPGLAAPKGFLLWSQFARQAAGRFSPASLLVAEWRLRGGRSWTPPQRDFTLVAAFPGSEADAALSTLLGAIMESKDATQH